MNARRDRGQQGCPRAHRNIGSVWQWRLSGRITTAARHVFKDPLRGADVITMGMILHDRNLEKKMHLSLHPDESPVAGRPDLQTSWEVRLASDLRRWRTIRGLQNAPVRPILSVTPPP